MTTEQLNHLKKTAGSGNRSKDDLWVRAFDEYNKEHQKQLSMMCMPCYAKVLNWLLNKEHAETVIQ